MLPLLLPLVLNLAPELAKWLFGDTASAATSKVVDAVAAVTGTSVADITAGPGEVAAVAALGANPEAQASLRIKLAQIAADHDKAAADAAAVALTARLADVASARGQTVDLAKAGSSVAWGAPVVSLVVLASFGVSLYAVLTQALPAGSETVANVMLGTLGGMAVAVVSYWVGSSSGSAAKTEMLYRSQPPGT